MAEPFILHFCHLPCLLFVCIVALLLEVAPPGQAYLQPALSATEKEASQCGWCGARADGWHPDCRATPPCSGFFLCADQRLLQVGVCPRGKAYDAHAGECVTAHEAQCSCTTAATEHLKDLRCQSLRCRIPTPQQFSRGLLQAEGDHVSAVKASVDYYNGTQWPQVNALLAFKARVRDPRRVLSNWVVPQEFKNPSFVCKWRGVQCNGAGGGEGQGVGRNSSAALTRDIAALDLSNKESDEVTGFWSMNALWGGLYSTAGEGCLPREISALTGLTALDLGFLGFFNSLPSQGLTGPLPEEITRCQKLQKLALRYNSFSGPLPSVLTAMASLQYLDLAFNNLYASSLDFLCQMRQLTFLDWSGNNVTGSIPSCLPALTGLSELRLYTTPTQGTIPESIGDMTWLELIDLTRNSRISGSIPDTFSRLKNLKSLSLNYLNISGSLPPTPWWRALSALEIVAIMHPFSLDGPLPQRAGPRLGSITVNGTQVSGPIPPKLQLSLCGQRPEEFQFTTLRLTNNRIEGPFPSLLAQCKALATLDLSHNVLGGEVPWRSLSSLAYLDVVTLQGNRFNGTLPADLFMRTSFLRLNLADNQFSGLCPPVACAANAALSYFNVSRNLLHGDASQILARPSCLLDVLDLSYNNISGSLPGRWALASSVFLQHNNITGPIPGGVKEDLIMLQRVKLQGNMLTGVIPASLMQDAPAVESLDLSRNKLSGGLPSFSGDQPWKSLDLSQNNLSGPIPESISGLGSIYALSLAHNALSGSVPATISNLAILSTINLSSNKFSGPITPSLGLLPGLLALSLAQNAFNGPIPGELAPPFLPRLTSLDLSFNSLQGVIPAGYTSRSGVVTSGWLNLSYNNLSGPVHSNLTEFQAPAMLAGNEFLCGGAGYPECPDPYPYSRLSTGQVAGICIGASIAFGLILAVALWWSLRITDPWDKGVMLTYHGVQVSIRDVLHCTNRFSKEFLLGSGGFGDVYRVDLPTGEVYAVKRLKVDATQGDDEFKAEVAVLGSVSHRNIVRLVAAFVANPPAKERLLIYDYLDGGSLDHIIVPDMPPSSPFRYLEVRRAVAQDVARGMRYLHHYCQPAIIHRDMKPPNVLLDSQMVGRIADFGLAKNLDPRVSHMTEQGVLGTAGFVAPEYTTLGRYGTKSDVYAYGVTLIQLMTGRRTSDEDIADRGLQRWATSGAGILDPNLVNLDEEKARLGVAMIKIGILCIARVPIDRPTMEEVVRLLEGLEEFANIA